MTDSNSHTSNLLKAGIVEIIFIIILVTTILVTLNYFNVIPLSSALPFLSFLPRSQSTTNLQSNNTMRTVNNTRTTPAAGQNTGVTKDIVVANKPFTVESKDQKFAYNNVPDSFTTSIGTLNIIVDLTIKPSSTEVSKSDASGIMFGHDFEKNKNYLSLFYLHSEQQWIFGYPGDNDKQQFASIIPMSGATIQGKFTITIAADGKSVAVVLPSGITRRFQWNQPMDLETVTHYVVGQAGPSSAVTINSLQYNFPGARAGSR